MYCTVVKTPNMSDRESIYSTSNDTMSEFEVLIHSWLAKTTTWGIADCEVNTLLPSSIQIATTCLVMTFCCVFIIKQGRRSQTKPSASTRNESESTLTITQSPICRRKEAFLRQAGNDYGYRQSPCGYIDNWRKHEFPGLLAPMELSKERNRSTQTRRETSSDVITGQQEEEVYLDYAGSALPSRSQLEAIASTLSSMILANPHSSGPAAARTMLLMEQAKTRILDHFQGHGGGRRTNGMQDDSVVSSRQHQRKDIHTGYEVVFTSGATESLRITAERFPWFHCHACHRRSRLVYPENAHTSVIGMRGPALSKGAAFICQEMDKCYVKTVSEITSQDSVPCEHCGDEKVHHLIVMTPECNFGGDRMPSLHETVLKLRAMSTKHNKLVILMDIAKAASTGPVDLCQLDADIAPVSFYKLFGEPTGVGCLLMKRSIACDVFGNTQDECSGQVRRYFGGGSVDIAIPSVDFVIGRNEPSPLASFSNGTCNFRGIASLGHGLNELSRLGGMESIRRHTLSLTRELVRRLRQLRHENGSIVVELYGAWRSVTLGSELSDAISPGPTVAFNVLREDGSFVGYNEVAKLAALNRPPIQFRTGCFCNPGACQSALQLSVTDVKRNYEEAGHVCGDQVDLIGGRPTGAIRISFGKESIWEDMETFISFIDRVFVSRAETLCENDSRWDGKPREVLLQELCIFPIKSCAAQAVQRWKVSCSSGKLLMDREFSLVDSSGTAMRLQSYPKMALIRPHIDLTSTLMTISAPGKADLIVSLNDSGNSELASREGTVKVCGNRCGGMLWGDDRVSDWFSDVLGVRCWLARYAGDKVSPPLSNETNLRSRYTRNPNVAFANEQPLLLISEHAVDALNSVLESRNEPRVSARQFRPNFVVRLVGNGNEGRLRHSEDGWTSLSFLEKNLHLQVSGPCARCSMVDVDPLNGSKHGSALRAMAEYRRNNGQITFGIFLQACNKHDQTQSAETEVWIEQGDLLLCQ